jgi:hypothetical protein
MPIELSGITFTEQDDFVAESGEQEILNNGFANTLAGNDLIVGNSENSINSSTQQSISGVYNIGTLDTDDGNDLIIGTGKNNDLILASVRNTISGIHNIGTLNTGNGNDVILGIRYKQEEYNSSFDNSYSYGIYHQRGLIDTGDGDDIITGFSKVSMSEGIYLYSGNPYSDDKGATINTGNGNDTITGTGNRSGIDISGSRSISNGSSIDTGNGNDIITGTGIDYGINFNSANNSIDTGKGDDIITGTGNWAIGIYSSSSYVNTGDGNDTITGIGYTFSIYNKGTINTGDGNDVIIGSSPNNSDDGFMINDGIINTGNGEDSIIFDKGFQGGGNVFLGNDKDYLRGFGYGNFNGGNDRDSLELTSGSYTIGILGAVVSFTKGANIMKTSEFEKLIAGSTTYDFTSLTDGQTILVA